MNRVGLTVTGYYLDASVGVAPRFSGPPIGVLWLSNNTIKKFSLPADVDNLENEDLLRLGLAQATISYTHIDRLGLDSQWDYRIWLRLG